MIEITRDDLAKMLINGIVEVEFTKADGKQRVMKCTLNPDYLPEPDEKEIKEYDGKPQKLVNPDQIRVYDIEADGFRTVTLSKLTRDPLPITMPVCDCSMECSGDCRDHHGHHGKVETPKSDIY